MPNEHVLQRLIGLQGILKGVRDGSATLSASSKGREREAFIGKFLAEVLPPIYRFGAGDATDSTGQRSGQLDVVVEYPFSPSLPNVLSPTSRLYLAESIAAVIEVKSDAAAQWEEAVSTAKQLAPLKRVFGAIMTTDYFPEETIPLFVVGYTGWSKVETLEKHLAENPEVTGILIIEPSLFVANRFNATGPLAL
jgi:hypothetical protein